MKIFYLLFLLLICNCIISNAQTAQQIKIIADSLYSNQNWKSAAMQYEKAFAMGEVPTALTANKLGYSYLKTGKYDLAIKNLELSLQKNPASSVIFIVMSRLATAYAGSNEKEKAFNELDSAITHGYGNFNELDTLKEFDKYRNDEVFKELESKVVDNAYPCMKNPHQREFDFWIGEWDVYQTGTQSLVGQSSIQMISGGCSILENWTAIGYPNSGKSLNFVDPANNKWKQVWVGSGGAVTDYINGVYKDSAMQFESTMSTPQGNAKVRFRFFNQGPNQVRQFQEYTNDDGKTWNVSYDLTYIRKKKN